MSKRRRWMWGLGVLGLLLAWLGIVLSDRMPRASAEEQAALATLQQAPRAADSERNGFAALWLLKYDVPAEQLQGVLAADIAAYDKLLKESGSVGSFETTAKGKFDEFPVPAGGEKALCEVWKGDCLERVADAPSATRERLAAAARPLERIRALATYDYFNYAFQPRLDSPLPSLGGVINLQLTDVAMKFFDGELDQAFATLCADTRTWRHLRAHTDMLVADMVGIAYLSNSAQLYAQMLARVPASFDAPCPESFAPLSDSEFDQCPRMHTEFRSSRNSLESAAWMVSDQAAPWMLDALVNNQHLIRRSALAIAPYCQDAQRARIARRDPTPIIAVPQCAIDGWVFDPVGCVMSRHLNLDYDLFYRRALDLDARLRLVATALSLRTAANDAASAFAARGSALDSPAHHFEHLASENKLRMRNLDSARGEYWEIPLAPPGVAAAGAGAFLAHLATLCGTAYPGKIVANEPANPDDQFAGKALVMHVRDCSPTRIAIPFHVGDDHSRTWIITRTPTGLRLEHDHRHADGSPDELTLYGGDTRGPGNANRLEFPINSSTTALFTRLDLAASLTNTWALELYPGKRFVYELARPGRLFRVEFDLTSPVPTPPPAWGSEPPPAN